MTETFLHILDSIADEASGPSYSVPGLCAALAEQGAEVVLMTIGRERADPSPWRHRAFPQDHAGVPVLRSMRFSAGLRDALHAAAPAATVLHAHGLWLMANVYPADAARAAGRPLVLSPRGMLGPAALRFSRTKKRLFWAALQGRAMRSVSCIHATSDLEYEDVRAFGLRAPVAVVPNGIHVPAAVAKPPAEGTRTALYLGRIHPKKGLDALVEAWGRVAPGRPDWRLDIVGPIDSDYARALAARVGGEGTIRLPGPLYGAEKGDAYRRADLFVMPTLNENFAMTVAEALAQATPVLCTRGAPWKGLEDHGCGWWVETGPDAIAAGLADAMDRDRAALRRMGEAGRGWMARDFGWDAIGRSMTGVYGWLAGRAPRPACVIEG